MDRQLVSREDQVGPHHELSQTRSKGCHTHVLCTCFLLSGRSKRTLITTCFCLPFAIGGTMIGVLAMYARTYINLMLMSTLPFLPMLSYYWILRESPRWLVANGRMEETKDWLRTVGRWKHVTYTEEQLDELISLASATELEDMKTQESARKTSNETGLLDLFRGRNMRLLTIVLTFAAVANAVVYLGIIFNSANLGPNFFLTYILGALVEAPGVLLPLFMCNRIGRILPFGSFLIMAGACCLLTVPGAAWPSAAIQAFVIAGKFGVTVSYTILGQVISELFPTVIRGLGYGFASTFGNAGSVIMPFIIESSKTFMALPMIILGALSICSGIACLFLPETLNRDMPDSLEDAENSEQVGFHSFLSHCKRVRGWFSCRRKSSEKEVPDEQ